MSNLVFPYKIRSFWKKFFCSHEYQQFKTWDFLSDTYALFQCSKCGSFKKVRIGYMGSGK